MTSKPRILLSNDDGINAPGLKVLEKIAKKLSDDIWIVAPEQEQSGASHSLTLHVPVRVRKISARKYAISGTPTDCVLLAAREILAGSKKKIDLVLSGVNRGSNVGDDITYSGTCAAAMEAAQLGIPAVALSQLFYDGKALHWETAEAFAPKVIKTLLKEQIPPNTFINLNFPACKPEAVKDIACAPQGKRKVSVALTLRKDPRGRPYYWLGGDRDDATDDPNVDIARLTAGYVTVTPVQMDMTDYRTLKKINALFSDPR